VSTKQRASKGLLLPPRTDPIPNAAAREAWLSKAKGTFVAPGEANKAIFSVILDKLWPEGHGIPGPHVSQTEIRQVIDDTRLSQGEQTYKDPFRRVRELQGEEGFTCIIKEGVNYQLISLNLSPKREPRAKPSKSLWEEIKSQTNFKCSHCGATEPPAKLSPDHRIPRSRGGTNDDENWQPLCEQCNNAKSSACQGCNLNCTVCYWAYPETYKPLVVNDANRELVRRMSDKMKINQSDMVNKVLEEYFRKFN
jgi:5-methylcytosine-specific restriction endonuclease McrA